MPPPTNEHDEAPPTKIVTVFQNEEGQLEILVDDDVSKFEALAMLQVAYGRQWKDVYDEEIADDAYWAEEGDE